MLAIALPDSLGPYAVLLAIGFIVGWYGHGARSNWIIAFGILFREKDRIGDAEPLESANSSIPA